MPRQSWSIPNLRPLPALIRWVLGLALLLLAVMALLRVGVYLHFHPDGERAPSPWPALLLGLRYDLRVTASLLLPVLLLGAIRPLHAFGGSRARRFWLGVMGVASAALVVVHVSDFLHLRYLNQRLSASVLGFLADAGISARMVWESYPVIWLALGIGAATGALSWACHRLHLWAGAVEPVSSRAVRAGWFVTVFLGGVVAIWGRVGQFPLRWSDAFNLGSDAQAHVALNPFQSFASTFGFEQRPFDRDRVREHYARMSGYLGVEAPDPERLEFARQVPAAPSRLTTGGDAGPVNVVLVLCESFSGYKSSMWGNPLDSTPFFAQLCREGVFFDNCFTPHVGTARGVWAALTGIPDTEPRETASRNPALVDQRTILSDFTGHDKLYFIGGSTSWANLRGLLTNNIAGLRLYEDGSYDAGRIDVWGIGDKALFLAAHDVLRRQTRPFFAVIQTADNHRPYTIPSADLGEFSRRTLPMEELRRGGFASNDEFNAFRYTDFTFRKFIEAARTAPYFDRTIFVFIGDHGIGGDAGTRFPAAWTEQNLTCYHVPLLFYAPKLLAPRRLSSVASQIDILPSIAGLLGMPYRNTGLGRDLFRQQDLDGGRSNVAFVIDHPSRSVGVVLGSYFLNHRREGGRDEFVWADFTRGEPAGSRPAPDEHRQWAQAFHETARYLLRHNPKPREPLLAALP